MKLQSLVLSLALTVAALSAEAAPYYPSFHNVDSSTFFANFDYYPSQGMGLQTLSLYRSGNQMKAAGSFDHGVTGAWYAYGLLTQGQFQFRFDQLNAQGFRPRELGVVMNNQGQPLFSAIWKKRQGEAYYTYHGMSDAGFTQRWNELVQNQGFRVEDHISYYVAGQRRHAAIFVKDGKAFYLYYNMTQQGLTNRYNQLSAQGFFPTSLQAVHTPQGVRYSAVWMKTPGLNATYVNMTAAGYQTRFNQMSAHGYRLKKVQGYANGTRFAAIWTK